METTNTNFWRLRINIKNNNTLELCQIRLKDMTWDEYKSKYKMTEISDKDTLVNIMTEEFSKGMKPIKATFDVYFDGSLKGNMTSAIKEVMDKFPGAHFEQCKDCKKFFLITDGDTKWYTEHELSLPKRCGDCRKRRKAEAKKKAATE